MNKQIPLLLLPFALCLSAPSFGAAPSAATLTDGQIAKILMTVNDGEIAAGKEALKQSKNEKVKSFAKMMVAQHEKNDADAKALTTKDKIELQSSDLAESMKKDAEASNGELTKASGSAFDAAYVNEQIKMHESALEGLKTKLIPGAQNPDLKAFLEKTSKAVQAHLNHAKAIQAKM